MNWNYRLVKYIHTNGYIHYGIHEAYYDDKDVVTSITKDIYCPNSFVDFFKDKEDILVARLDYIRDFRMYLKAVSKPVVVYNESTDSFLDEEVSTDYEVDFGDLYK